MNKSLLRERCNRSLYKTHNHCVICLEKLFIKLKVFIYLFKDLIQNQFNYKYIFS
jgi:hypothetical protein